MELKKLKSGTDIRGVALDGYGEEVNLTQAAADKLTRAFISKKKIRRRKKSPSEEIRVFRDRHLRNR